MTDALTDAYETVAVAEESAAIAARLTSGNRLTMRV